MPWNIMKHDICYVVQKFIHMRPCYIETSNTPPEAFPIKCRMVSAEKVSASRGTLDMVTIRSARASFPIRSSRKRTWFLASRTRGVILEFPASPQSCQKWINWEGYIQLQWYTVGPALPQLHFFLPMFMAKNGKFQGETIPKIPGATSCSKRPDW